MVTRTREHVNYITDLGDFDIGRVFLHFKGGKWRKRAVIGRVPARAACATTILTTFAG